jgi:hypothetical protein
VEAELAARRPTSTPPFSAVRARKHRRDRRRTAGAVALSVVAVLAVAGGAAVLHATGGGQGAPRRLAGPRAGALTYSIAWRGVAGFDSSEETGLHEQCATLPGVSPGLTFQSLPPILTGQIGPGADLQAFRDCVQRVAPRAVLTTSAAVDAPQTSPTASSPTCAGGAGPSFQDCRVPARARYAVGYARLVEQDFSAQDQAVQRCLRLPGTSHLSPMMEMPPSYEVTVAGQAENRAFSACITAIGDVTIHAVSLDDTTSLVQVSGVMSAVGGPSGASVEGLPGEVVFQGAAGRFTAEADPAGKFGLALPAGEYTATGTSPRYGDGEAECRAANRISVSTTDLLDVQVACPRH